MSSKSRLQLAIAHLGISDRQLAAELGVSIAGARNYLADSSKLRGVVALGIQAQFGIRAEWLQSGKGSMWTQQSGASVEAASAAHSYCRLTPAHRGMFRSILAGLARLR